MADYKKMYTTLFNEVTDIIERLQTAQRETEEIYICSEKRQMRVINTEQEKQERQ